MNPRVDDVRAEITRSMGQPEESVESISLTFFLLFGLIRAKEEAEGDYPGQGGSQRHQSLTAEPEFQA